MTGKRWMIHCAKCDGTNLHGTAWVNVNTDELVNADPPTDQIWCADCDAEVDCRIVVHDRW